MKKYSLIAMLVIGTTPLGLSSANAGVLDFSGLGLGNGNPIPQTYGDEANLNVSYRSVIEPGSSTTVTPNMLYWNNSYSDLVDVAYGAAGRTAEVTLEVTTPGFQVELLGFDLGAWPTTNRPSQVQIYNLDYSQLLYSSGDITVLGSDASEFTFTNIVRSDGVRIQFGPDAFNVGIDNIEFDVSVVPEPLTILGAGTAIAFGTGFKRKLAKAKKK